MKAVFFVKKLAAFFVFNYILFINFIIYRGITWPSISFKQKCLSFLN